MLQQVTSPESRQNKKKDAAQSTPSKTKADVDAVTASVKNLKVESAQKSSNN